MKKKLLMCFLMLACALVINCQSKENIECNGGWVKYENNPVLGGELGTIFDISVLKNNDGIYQMFCSWRPKKSIALSESRDGLKWSLPVVCLATTRIVVGKKI
jgi:beta-1,2-mannobiose phosphorylase / 1,2-beta-oligomannan phosphorylase